MSKQALPGSRLNAFAMEPGDLVIIGLDTDDGPEHPLYDERIHLPLDLALLHNIMHNGVLENVLVRKNGDAIEVSAGRQRVRCVREANKRFAAEGKMPIRVPVMVKRGSDGDMFGIMISENECRRDDGLMSKASNLQRYMNMGYSEDDAAVTFGVSTQTIRAWGKLLDLDPKVIKAINGNRISASAASRLADLPRKQQCEELSGLLAKGVVTAAAASRATKSRKNGTQATAAPSKRTVRKVLAANAGDDVLDPEFIRGVKWVLGELSSDSIKGMDGLVSEAG